MVISKENILPWVGFLVTITVGVLVAVYATWLSLGLITLLTLISWMRADYLNSEHGRRSAHDAFAVSGALCIVTGIGWFWMAFGRPVWLLFHGETIVISTSQFFR